MPTKLKNLRITSTDLVKQGANPDSYVCLFKRRDEPELSLELGSQPKTDTKLEAIMQKCISAISEIFKKLPGGVLEGSKADDGGFLEILEAEENKLREEGNSMKVDKSKMTPEDAEIFARLEKKYNLTDEVETAGAELAKDAGKPLAEPETKAELHPEVRKALEENACLAAEVEKLKKSLEIKDLTSFAKKYEILGKKPEELAETLYELKKAGGNHYQTTITLLDEQITLVEKSGLFSEYGRNTAGGIGVGGELEAKAAEIKKSNAAMTDAEAFAKAYETYPDLAEKYERMYRGRE